MKFHIVITTLILFLFSKFVLHSQCSTSLKFSTFQGGNGADEVVDLYVHPTSKYIYTIALTESANLAPTNGDIGLGGTGKSYVQCMNNNGTLRWSTMISGLDKPIRIFADDAGNPIIVAETKHGNLPMLGSGADKVFSGVSDLVYLKLNIAGNSVIGSSYIGGNGEDKLEKSDSDANLKNNLDFKFNRIIGIAFTSSSDIQPSNNALSSNQGESYIFSYDTNAEAFTYKSYYMYNGGEAITISDNGNIFMIMANEEPQPSQTLQFITNNAIISSYIFNPHNFPKLLLVLNSSFLKVYGSFITNNNLSTYVSNGTPFTPLDLLDPDIEVDQDENIYILSQYYFKEPFYQEKLDFPLILGGSGLDKIIKLKKQSLSNYQLEYLHYTNSNANGTNNTNYTACDIEIDKQNRVHLISNNAQSQVEYSNNFSASLVQIGNQSPFRTIHQIFEQNSNNVELNTVFQSGNDLDETIILNGLFIDGDNYYLVGKCNKAIFPVTPSWRDFNNNTHVNIQQPNYGGGSNDGFISVFHTPIPGLKNILDFPAGTNTFCRNSFISNNGQQLGTPITSYVSGDGSSDLHIVPNYKRGNQFFAHPIPRIRYQWQKSTNNINWVNIAGATQEQYQPAPESASGNVYYRRNTEDCCGNISIGNSVQAIINATSNAMTVSFASTSYKHCPGTATTLGVTVAGGNNNISWKWYNGYDNTTDISPESGTGSSISAQVKATTTQGGVYRLVVKNNVSGCEIEAFVTVIVARVDLRDTISLCPNNTACVNIGPQFFDLTYAFSWSGPSNFTSTATNPCVQNVGRYILTLNNCPTTRDTVVLASTPHHVNLTSGTMPPSEDFCQYKDPRQIGLNTSAPPGYTFQWAPTRNIEDITQYKPTYRPNELLTGNSQVYTFSAIRNSDGCVFSKDLTINLTPGTEIKGDENTLLCDGEDVLNARIQGNFYRWTVIATTFSGGVNALVSNANFKLNNLNQATTTVLNPVMRYPLGSGSGYTITFRIEASFLPLGATNICTVTYEQIYYIRPCGTITGCPKGTIKTNVIPGLFDGVCGSSNTVLNSNAPFGSSVTWTIDQLDNTNNTTTPIFGLFDLNNVILPVPGPHPTSVIANLDYAGTPPNNSVRYRATYSNNNGTSCYDTIRVYSKIRNTPIVDLKPVFSACETLGGTLTAGNILPASLPMTMYNSSPNPNILWSWSDLSGSTSSISGTTPYPNITEGGTFIGKGTDRLSGCIDLDTFKVEVIKINGSAGLDITDVCKNTIFQLQAGENTNDYTYLWTPPVGLNFPIGTANNTVTRPFATVNGNQIYTLKTKRGSCETTDQVEIKVSTVGPPAIISKTIDACIGDPITIESNADINCNGCTYTWSVVSGGQLSWLSSVNTAEPFITVPIGINLTSAVFRLESKKGDCGVTSGTFTINIRNTPKPVITDVINIGCTLPLPAWTITNHTSGTTYDWSFVPNNNVPVLYQNSNMTNPINSGINTFSTIYPFTTTSQSYNVRAIKNGCVSDPVVVNAINTSDFIAIAGSDLSLCNPGNSGTIGATLNYPTGATVTWSAIGFSTDPNATSFSPPISNAQKTQIESWLSSLTHPTPFVNRPNNSSFVGAYQYKVVVKVGTCTSEDIVVVRYLRINFPQINFEGPNSICANQCRFIVAEPYPSSNFQYQWSATPVSEVQNITFPYFATPIVCPKVNTTYSLIIIDPASGCKSLPYTQTYTIIPSPTLGDDLTIELCNSSFTANLTSYIPNYASYTSKIWVNLSDNTIISNPNNYVISSNQSVQLRVANQNGCTDEIKIDFVLPSTQLNNDQFYYLTGHDDDNVATKIKFIGGHVYLSYLHYKGSEYTAGMAKYNRDGTVVWDKLLTYPSRINDFEEDENCDIIAIGHKGIFNNTTDNTSLLITFNKDNGNQVYGKEFTNPGREEFKKIIKNNSITGGKYLFTGTRNPQTVVNLDIPRLINYNYNAIQNNAVLELTNPANDIETDRGLLQLSDGTVLMFGNEGNTGRGTFSVINMNSNTVSSKVTDLKIDFYDGIETSDNKIILIGDKFDSKEGVIVVLSNKYDLISYYNFPKNEGFREIKHKTGDVYFIMCKSKETNPKIVLFSFSLAYGLITTNLGYYIDDADTDRQSYWFDYDKLNKKIAYVDTRKVTNNGFGKLDVFLGVFDDQLSLDCTKSTLIASQRKTLKLESPGYTSSKQNYNQVNVSGITNNSYKNKNLVCECKNDTEKPVLSSLFNELEFPIAANKEVKINWSTFRFTTYDNCSNVKLDTSMRVYNCSNVGQILNIVIKATDESSNESQYIVRLIITDPNGFCNSNPCPHPDYTALRDLYNSTNGSQWSNTVAGDLPWLADCDPCGLIDGTPWKGLECNNMGRVDVINLNNNNLVGSLPSSIGQLTALEWFNVNRNNLGGSLPPEICNLDRMLHFVISNNMFSGNFPACFANLTSLVRIVANDNKFTGTLPILGGSTQPGLINLHFDNNMFSGGIPSQYADLINLNYLAVANNDLSGCYPQQLSAFCTDPNFTSNTNALISDGNSFNASWSQFCATGAGSCTVSTSDQDLSNITVYPNPVLNELYINIIGIKSSFDFKVYDNTGRQQDIKSLDLQNGINSLDVSLLPPGIYFLRIGTKEYQKFTKFIKID